MAQTATLTLERALLERIERALATSALVLEAAPSGTLDPSAQAFEDRTLAQILRGYLQVPRPLKPYLLPRLPDASAEE